MDYFLENLRTGEQFSLDPNRTLIGTADHATIRTEESGPFLSALIVSYISGWAVHGLADEDVLFNGRPLRVTQQVTPHGGDVLEISQDRFRFDIVADSPAAPPFEEPESLPSCFAYIRFPDGMEECRVVDHNLLFGRLRVCHVRYPDTKLSRLNALFAAHGNMWYVHSLSKSMIARNRRAVSDFAPLEDGDELLIGPLSVKIEMRAQSAANKEMGEQVHSNQETVTGISEPQKSAAISSVTDAPTMETTLPADSADVPPGMAAIYVAGIRLDQWLKSQKLPDSKVAAAGTWFGAQKEKLRRFWYDTPETTTARVLRTAGKPDEAFTVLDRAIRARPDSPDLLRELYRLYDSIGMHELCFRPLRQIEKLATARGGLDTWVLETLARLCERLGKQRAGMYDRAVSYWTKLKRATGINYAREKAATMASRTLAEAGFSRSSNEDL